LRHEFGFRECFSRLFSYFCSWPIYWYGRVFSGPDCGGNGNLVLLDQLRHHHFTDADGNHSGQKRVHASEKCANSLAWLWMLLDRLFPVDNLPALVEFHTRLVHIDSVVVLVSQTDGGQKSASECHPQLLADCRRRPV
jgi:hypothetical protein